ncbi:MULTISPECIES: hypothetical protein [Chryseobacterium]|uniref:Uncharacterized protein n=1 Tax=Chryseobacterium culicis TaxID=680127 RepID=A0A1H6H2I6_CHRCI|nr:MULTISPECIES: hypothetical protein [Chryseobacterium]UHO38212.1 hypothetical protein H5J24_22060 [Chryseobacterium capnotolerans]SEH29921.1 hypothetical protein SAMN05421593_1220 [Chryseobacterium culicis]
MEIKYGKQVDIDNINGISIDLLILAGNHEKRMLTLFDKVKDKNEIKKTIMFRFKDDFKPISNNFELQTIKDCNQIYYLLDNIFTNHNKENFTLLVDYSCMTKSWYYSIILYLSKKNLKQKNIRVLFSYTPSKYSEPLTPKPNSDIAPLPGKYVIPTDKPKALIVCLGYEQNKAEGIIEHLDPKFCHIFYTKPSLDSMFSKKIEENNKTIISERKNQITTYAFGDLLNLERSLNGLYQTLKKDYSIIIAPLGPKPFALVSMIMAAKYPEIDIWRVGSGYDINEYDREPLDNNFYIINDLYFSNN